MNVRRLFLPSVLSVLSLTTWMGCSAGNAYDIGRQAEKRGDAHLAHDYYLQAGVKRPGNSAIRDGLKRTAPGAANFWRTQAAVAQDQGRYDDAWRMLMKALAIQPSDQRTLDAIRKIEAEHGQAVAAAKADWQKRGSAALEVQLARADDNMGASAAASPEPMAAAEPKPRAPAKTAAAPPRPVARTEPPASPKVTAAPSQPRAQPTPVAQAIAGDAPPHTGANKRETATEPPKREVVAAKPATQEPFTLRYSDTTRTSDAEQTSADRPAAGDRSAVTRRSDAVERQDRSSTPVTASPSAQAATPDRDAPQAGQRKPAKALHDAPVLTEREYARAMDDHKTSRDASRAENSYLVVRTLSRKNKRLPKEDLLIDGVTVKLKDTDDELDADLNLYIGGKKVREIRNLGIGRPRAFEGKSGKSYLMTILSIHHASHTVRIGVKPE